MARERKRIDRSEALRLAAEAAAKGVKLEDIKEVLKDFLDVIQPVFDTYLENVKFLETNFTIIEADILEPSVKPDKKYKNDYIRKMREADHGNSSSDD